MSALEAKTLLLLRFALAKSRLEDRARSFPLESTAIALGLMELNECEECAKEVIAHLERQLLLTDTI